MRCGAWVLGLKGLGGWDGEADVDVEGRGKFPSVFHGVAWWEMYAHRFCLSKEILEESERERNRVAGCCICLIPVIHTYFIIKTFYCDVHFERGIGGSGAQCVK
jgi:hypothetical protein